MRDSYDPLSYIPSVDAIRKHLAHAQALVRRLRVLLRVATQIEATRTDSGEPQRGNRKEVADGR